jgi:hypothetical protein
MLLLALPVGAGDFYPAPAFFADGLTERSSWEQILAKPDKQGDFPLLDFGQTLVPISALCVDTAMLRIADPRIDNGVTVAVERVGGILRAGGGTGDDRLAAVGPAATLGSGDQSGGAPLGYPVSVYKVFLRPQTIERIFLFNKYWWIPRCPAG